MELTLCGHNERYAVEQLLLSLFGNTPGQAVVSLRRGAVYITARAEITVAGRTACGVRRLKAAEETVRTRRQKLQLAVYAAACKLLPEPPPWGALAGVRPTKLTTAYLLNGHSSAEADRFLRSIYSVTPARRKLCVECSQQSAAVCGGLRPGDVSVYVGIPFCPTRCAYCSFVSRGVGKKTELIAPFLNALLREIELTGSLLRREGCSVHTLYIGGGTPTTLSREQLEQLLEQLCKCLPLHSCIEFTVEAGRPDTIDEVKLRTLREYNVDRISINPQSMTDSVLRASGRPHSAADIVNSFRLARAAGFPFINMDLIAGLPTDTPAGVLQSLDKVLALAPENITLHTLALKKGSDLMENPAARMNAAELETVLRQAEERLRGAGYAPYYLYRQKYMSGSFENVGWAQKGTACLYNICMMEELHTVIALGGGGMSKLALPDGRLLRFHNPKYPEPYLQQLERTLAQKRELMDRYGALGCGQKPYIFAKEFRE